MLLNYSMPLYTDFMPNSEIKHITSYIFIGIYFLNISGNLLLIIADCLSNIKAKFKRFLRIRKFKMLLKQKLSILIQEKAVSKKLNSRKKLSKIVENDIEDTESADESS